VLGGLLVVRADVDVLVAVRLVVQVVHGLPRGATKLCAVSCRAQSRLVAFGGEDTKPAARVAARVAAIARLRPPPYATFDRGSRHHNLYLALVSRMWLRRIFLAFAVCNMAF